MNTCKTRIRAEHVVGKQNQNKINLIKQVMRKFLNGSNLKINYLTQSNVTILNSDL